MAFAILHNSIHHHMSHTITWRVTGMHCASCERTIEQELLSVPGVAQAEVSLAQGRAGIEFEIENEPDVSGAFERLKKLGYRFNRETPSTMQDVSQRHEADPDACSLPTNAPIKTRILRALIALGITAFVFFIILNPLLKSIPEINASASVIALFGFGVVASLSTCLASTGGYLLAFSSKNPSKSRTALIHAGRLATFALGGAVLGALGQGLPTLGGGFYGSLALILGIGFFFAALNLLNLSPSLGKFGIRLPKSISRFADKAASSEHPFAPLLVGASTFILPCGFTQTVQALALASGDPIRGMFMMLFFALGTLPVLGGLTAFGSLATLKHQAVRLAIGSILLFFAVGQIDGGLTLLGSPVTPKSLLSGFSSSTPSVETPAANAAEGEQIIRMEVNSYGYEPERLTVKAGIPVKWEIDGRGIGGCTRDIVIPSLKIQKTLVKGTNLITFTPKKAGTIPFSCGMGMVRGSITVIN